MSEAVRPTKKQRELLDYIEAFIAEHGYSPSYREIMNGLQYTSVATVALHVGNLIKRGHLRKRDHSARSLEVVRDGQTATDQAAAVNHEDWLVRRVETHLEQAAVAGAADVAADARTLVDALRVLGLAEQAERLQNRLLAREMAVQ